MAQRESASGGVELRINGQTVQSDAGARLLDVAEDNGIFIPHLCYYRGLSPYAGCRMCVVEVEGVRGFPMACTLTVSAGMDVRTQTDALLELQRGAMELLLSDHPNRCFTCHREELCPPFNTCLRDAELTFRCLTCTKNARCELQSTAEYLGMIARERFDSDPRSWYREREVIPVERDDPFVERDYNLCIICTRCVRVCEEVRGMSVYALTERAGKARIQTVGGLPLHQTDCDFCGLCVDVCPTASLMYKETKWSLDYYGPPDPARVAEYNRERGLKGTWGEAVERFRQRKPLAVPKTSRQ